MVDNIIKLLNVIREMSCSISYRVSNFVDKTSILMLWWCVVLLRAPISGFIIDLAKYKLEQWLGRYCEPSTHFITLNGRIIRLSTHSVLLFDSTKTDPHTHTHTRALNDSHKNIDMCYIACIAHFQIVELERTYSSCIQLHIYTSVQLFVL